MNRRSFVKKTAFAGAGLTVTGTGMAVPRDSSDLALPVTKEWSFHFFSKHLQFLDYREAAKACAEAGMDGADLTVRPGGHVEPGQVERDLPLAVKAFEEAGLNILMMVSNITDADDPLTEQVLRTASELGIRYYRMGYYSYDHGNSMQKNLDGIRKKMDKLAALNETYQIHGAYQNHAGDRFGAPVWDLWEVIRNLDPRWTGCQFDVRHATAEGRRSWPLGLRALKDYIQCLVAKDFTLEKIDGKAGEVHVPLGEGIVDFPAYFKLLEELKIRGPISVHIEYPMFADENLPLPDKKARAIELMRKDLNACKSYLKPYESK